MKPLFFWMSLLIFCSVCFYNCSRAVVQIPNSTSAENITPELYPNQDSELALLMRQMDKDALQIKEAILQNTSLMDIRSKFAHILTATPTDSSTKTPAFEAMSHSFLKSLENLYTTSDKKNAYNLMINSCLTCHKSSCPGPTVRIQKLLIP